MNDFRDNFSPMLIDQQIENPDALLSPADAHFIHNMHTLFEQETSASIEQGWHRLVSQRTGVDRPGEVVNFSTYKQRDEKASIVDERTLFTTLTQSARKKRLPRLLGQIAAVLVCIALVGSLVLILTVAKNKSASTIPGTRGIQASTAMPVATSTLTIPATCKDSTDLAEQTLCARGEETTINLTRSFTCKTYDSQGKISGSGTVNVTFHRAYADTSRLILVYTINQAPATNWGGFESLATNLGMLRTFESPWQKGLFTQSFDTSNLSASTTQLHIQAIGTTFGTSVSLTFTLPFNATSKTVTLKQTRSGTGYKLTLKQLVLTNSSTTLVFTLAYSQTSSFPPDLQVTGFSFNGQKQTVVPGNPTGSGESDQPGIENETLSLAQSLLDQPGAWTVTLSLRSTNPGLSKLLGEETFAFSVPS